jgi:DegV family protein with EDD domain
MLRIVTDGGADMPEEWLQEYQINLLPLRIRFGEEDFTQGVNIDKTSFYRMVEERKMIPNTSLPSPQQVADFYRSIAKKGDDILSVHIASKLSGTFSIIQLAAKDLTGEFNVFPFDSGAGSAIQGFMCREARRMDQAGRSVQNILMKLEEIRKKVVVIFTLDTLDYARMNGRINGLVSALTSLLKVKPIVILGDGTLNMGEKVRSRHKSIDRVIELVQQRIGDRSTAMAVVHANDPATAQSIYDRMHEIANVKELIITELAIPVAANLGPGTVGIAAYIMD